MQLKELKPGFWCYLGIHYPGGEAQHRYEAWDQGDCYMTRVCTRCGIDLRAPGQTI